jgi:hypothetical protein
MDVLGIKQRAQKQLRVDIWKYQSGLERTNVLGMKRHVQKPQKKEALRAALARHLNILKWARERNCPWNEKILCSYAAMERHLEILKWAREFFCLWNEATYECVKCCSDERVLGWMILQQSIKLI